jgi:hypothetical protein
MLGGLCLNFQAGRTLTINGNEMDCVGASSWTIPPTRNGGYCIQVSAGQPDYAAFTCW